MLNPIYRLLTWLVLLLGLAGSGAAGYWVKFDIDTLAYQEFVSYCGEIKLKITARLKAHEQTLLGGAALFDASKTVERQEWYAYANRLRLNEHFSGIQGLCFAAWILPSQLATHESLIRAEGFPDYKVHPEGKREAYAPVVYIEPFTEPNLRAFGYDNHSEPVRSVAMLRACDENIVVLSGRVTLVQETDKDVQAGTLMFAPVYKKNEPIATPEQRRAALFGWVDSPFRMNDLLNGIVSSTENINVAQVHLRVYDGDNTQAEHLLYDSNTKYSAPESTDKVSLVKISNDFNGTIWTLRFEKITKAGDLGYGKAWITLGTGVLISALLFLLSSSYLRTWINATNIATRLTKELLESESRFRLLADSAPVLIWLSGLDKLCYHFNKGWLDFTGRTLAQELGNGWTEGLHPDDLQRCLNIYVSAFDDHLPFKMEYRLRRYDGEYRWIFDTGVPIFADDDTFLGYIGSCIDITERKWAETELRIAATVFESQEGMLITDANEVILNVNQAFTLITGYSASEMIGKTPRLLQSGRHNKAFYKSMWQIVHDTGAWQGEIWNRRKNGEIYPEQLTITAVKGDSDIITHYVSTMADITERKAMDEYVNRLAFYDPLTQLPNRRLLQQRLAHGIELYHRTGSQMAVFMMDLDKFKAVNDTLGHAVGDELLQQVAERIKACLREVDMVARLGGDEFVILIDNVSHPEHLARIAETIIHALSQAFTMDQGHEVYIGASIGIGIYPQHGDNAETLMDNADIALYYAKDQGRGCFVYFSEVLTQKSHERIALESRLRHAVEQQTLCVYFQPQIDIESNQLIGVEASVCWYDAVKDCYLMLKEIIAFIEDTGLIVAIGEWGLREICKLGQQWLNEGLPAVMLTVNIAPCQFRYGDVESLIAEVLHDTGFPAEYLGLEIGEAGLIDNQEHALPILNSLHEQGTHLIIGNFGTGYSSLAYLKHFPIDILKIDKTFIDDIPFSQDDNVITSTIIDMAHHLGFKVLAEGVETPEQLAFLRQYGCDRYQGSLYSKALSASDFAALLHNLVSVA